MSDTKQQGPTPRNLVVGHATQQWRKLKAREALNLETVAEVRQVVHTSGS